MTKYKCLKHGLLAKSERIIWEGAPSRGRWCVYCFRDAMNYIIEKYLNGGLIEINDETDQLT